MPSSTIHTARPSSSPGLLRRIAGGTVRRVVETYRLGGRSLVAAPALVAIAVLPELAQHVVEIRLGMFGSLEAFRSLANDPTRWAFGYVKVAGFVIAIIAVARFWAVDGDRRRLVRLGWWAVGRIVLSIVFAAAASWLLTRLGGQGAAADVGRTIASLLLQTAMTVYMAGALLGDRDATLWWSVSGGWPRALFMTLLLALVFLPCQALHMADHRLAIGQPTALVWVIMAWDGLFVGLFAALVGSATYVGYRHGPDWHGWTAPID